MSLRKLLWLFKRGNTLSRLKSLFSYLRLIIEIEHNNRFDFQTKEFHRQIIEITNLRKSIENYSEDKIQKLGERLNYLRNRQMDLDSKADRVIQRMMNKGAPTFNEFEKQYYDSLQRIAGSINGENGLKEKITMVLFFNQFAFMKLFIL